MGCDQQNKNRDCALFSISSSFELAFKGVGGSGTVMGVSTTAGAFRCRSILTYRNNPSYTSMVILIFLSERSNTDQIRIKLRPCKANTICSRNRVLTYPCTS